MNKLAALWRHNRILFLAFLVSTLVALVFAGRFLLFMIYWQDPAHRDQPVEGWMTVRYIAQSYRVPVEELSQKLEIGPHPGPRRSIAEIAKDRGIELDSLKAEITEAIAGLRQGGAPR